MSLFTRMVLLGFGVFAGSSLNAQSLWISRMPELVAACDATAVASSDEDAVVDRIGLLQNAAAMPGSGDIALFVRPVPGDETKIVVCALNAGAGQDLVRETVPAGPVLLAYCHGSDDETCLVAIAEAVGKAWRGIRWTVPRLAWLHEDGSDAPAEVRREAMESLATGKQPLRTPPDALAKLTQVGTLHVLRLTDEQASGMLAQPDDEPTEKAEAATGIDAAISKAVANVDLLQSYLECNNGALPSSYGVLDDPGVSEQTEIDFGEQEGGWRLSVSPARRVFGFDVSEVTVHVGERFNYRLLLVPLPIVSVRDQVSTVLDESWLEDEFGDGRLIREPIDPAAITYSFARRDLLLAPKSNAETWIFCHGDDGSGVGGE